MDLPQDQPVLSGEEAYALTTKPGKAPQWLSEPREKLTWGAFSQPLFLRRER
jgi:hypothetical protein